MAGSLNDKWIQRIRGLANTHRDKDTTTFKTVVLGYQGVGKTALIVRCLADRFYNNYVSEPEETYQYSVTFGQKKVMYDIIETKGKNSAIISHADAVLLVFSITDLLSFQHAKEMVVKLKELLSLRKSTPIILIANKTDRNKYREVQKEEYEKLSRDENLKCFELSAAIPLVKLDVVFEEIYQQAYLNRKKRRPNSCVLTPTKIPPYERRMSKSLGEDEFMNIVHPRPRSCCGSFSTLRPHSEVLEPPEQV